MKQPLVSIVIVCYNAKPFLKDCYDSVRALNYPKDRIEVILADNASTDDSVEFTRKNYPWVRVLQLDQNYGYTEGNNRGLAAAAGEYVMFLNQDTKVDPNWLAELVKVVESDDRIGIAGSLVRDFNKPKLIQNAENRIDIFGSLIHKGWGEEDSGQFKEPKDVFFVSGVAIMIRKSLMNELRYCFDKTYFMYFEEVDLCWRVNLLGYRVVLVPSSIVYHKGNMVPEKVKPENILRMTRNKIMSFRKNLSFPLRHILLVPVLLRTFVAVAYWFSKGMWPFGLKFLSALTAQVNHDLNIGNISWKRQLQVFSMPDFGSYFRFLKISGKFK